jgi:uncharacterized Ntn-hydrolase superfamily protein
MKLQPGIPFHTFSITAWCERTDRLGVAITTRAITAGSRYPFVKATMGAVATQANTDPRLVPMALRLIETGHSASKALKELGANNPFIEYRQLAVVDRDGNSAAPTGRENQEWPGHIAERNYVAMGNVLLGRHVIDAMSHAFEESPDEELEERLLLSIEADRDAGGQHGKQISSGLLVCDEEKYRRVDLRVDEHPELVEELRRISRRYRPQIGFYNMLPKDPTIPSP